MQEEESDHKHDWKRNSYRNIKQCRICGVTWSTEPPPPNYSDIPIGGRTSEDPVGIATEQGYIRATKVA